MCRDVHHKRLAPILWSDRLNLPAYLQHSLVPRRDKATRLEPLNLGIERVRFHERYLSSADSSQVAEARRAALLQGAAYPRVSFQSIGRIRSSNATAGAPSTRAMIPHATAVRTAANVSPALPAAV